MSGEFVPVIHAGSDDRPDEADTAFAAWSVASALNRLGYQSEVVQLGLDLSPLQVLKARQPLAVFNLVDAINGDDRLIGVVPSVLEHLALPFTGGGSEAFANTRSKCLSKEILRSAGVQSAGWSSDGSDCDPSLKYIVKSDALHGSLGMDEKSVISGADAAAEITSRSSRFGGRFFCEQYIEGREFNVAMIGQGRPGGPARCLPIQEIDFTGFPDDRPMIVDYGAKWDGDDAAYHTTNRRFGLEKTEPALADRLQRISMQAWHALSLNGYARVDFRVDAAGNPYVLEVNVNPALAPDAGFPAAALEEGMDYEQMIQTLLQLSLNIADSEQPLPIAAEQADSNLVEAPGIDQENAAISWRTQVTPNDIGAICELVRQTGFFNADEVAIAGELVEERLTKGAASGYEFIIAEQGGVIAGYACFGKIDGTDSSFDLYWIAVNPACQRQGLGRKIMNKAESIMREMGASLIYVDTSSSDKYRATRAFYLSMGYVENARLDNFYHEGDGKVIFVSACSVPNR
ncbi:MAG: GNAT family N-acetyltransferase [Rhodospirillales bacterium]